MPAFKCAYLVHGDDHGRISERRAKLRALAESESGASGLECFEGDASTPEAVAFALNSMTFVMGRRFLIVDGVERWKDADVQELLVPVIKTLGDDTTVAFFGRDEGRWKVPPKLAAAVKAAGGDVAVQETLKAKDLPRWTVEEATRLGLSLDLGGAQALVGQVGERQQRLLREIEKLALQLGPGAEVGSAEIDALAAHSAERQVWAFADALVARDLAGATRAFLQLRAQGEAIARLIPLLAKRLREVLAVAARIEAGESPTQIRDGLKMPSWMADRRVREARRADAEGLRRALEILAALELDSRGASELSDDTAALRAFAAMAA